MTEAAIPEGSGSQTVVTAPAAQAPVVETTTQQQAPEGKTVEAAPAAEGVKTEAKTEAPQGAPDKYEFTPAEGQKFDDKVIEQFSEVAKELNLPQEAAQKMLDKVAPVLAARQAEQMEAARTAWA
ncbi:MAG TPA: protease, partial [Oxalobacteraceae bacterium]|nr:protease [Oxalobacteraceae bacterium]